jgi:EmrB/QacA subfamily drug resistance transporter
VIFIGLLLGILMSALDQTIVATALPTIASDLHGLKEISWIITAYLLGQTISIPIYGKIGDFIGRRNAFHLAIAIFLAGSIVTGLSQSMGMLIALRAVQGIGAGGLLVGAQTIIAEIVSARERGKYMSIMGPMIGVATVLGPLLGGYLTQHATWRWIFYINVPIAAAAVIVTTRTLKLPRPQSKRRTDLAGTALMAAAVTSLILALTWGGRRYAWTSAIIIGLLAAFIILVPLFLRAERRAEEPILPLRLFRDDVFRINTALALVIGIAMFGAISYLPTFLQLSLGASATFSGVLLLPLMGGLMAAAVVTGQVISRTGRYKVFPIIGTAIAAIGLYLLSLMNAGTSRGESSLYMVVLGVGIGFIMPTLVLTVQNSVGVKDMSPATAGVNFFRQIGAAFGTSLIGSLFIGRLTTNLAHSLPPGAAAKIGQHASGINPAQLAKLPPNIAHDFVVSYANALTPLYVYFVPLLAAGFVLAWFLKEKPLNTVLARGSAAQNAQQREAPDAKTEEHVPVSASPAGGSASVGAAAAESASRDSSD